MALIFHYGILLRMSTKVKKLLDDALSQLTESERALLAASLIDSLDSEEDPSVESAWEKEISRRLIEITSGAISPLSWSEARKKILDIY